MILRLLALTTLFTASLAAAQGAADPAEMFGVRESVEQVDISPDGRRLVYLAGGPGRETFVFVHELDSGADPRILTRSSGAPERFRWCRFASNDRVVCELTGMREVNTVLVPFSRLAAFDVAGGDDLVVLGEQGSVFDARVRQYDGNIIDWFAGQQSAVLMARQYIPEAGRIGTRLTRISDGLAVDRIDVRTGRVTRVESPNRNAIRYWSDGLGKVRMMATQALRGNTGRDSASLDFFYRVPGNDDWRPFGSYNTVTGDGIMPLAVDASLNAAYVLRKLDGRFALYRVKLDGTMASELVHANPQVDIDDIIRASRGSRVIGLTFAEDRRRNHYFDADYAALAHSLGRAIPSLPLIDFRGASHDGNRILVHAGSDIDAGRFYLYDRSTRRLNEILMVRPRLEGARLANVRAVSYPAADGTQVPAYLTLPQGADARGLPAVILPHAGPSRRSEWEFDWLAQYLASRGYAVLQPNYRGSAGYGDEWFQRNGFQGWRTSIGDITAGARWLAAEGIADADRIGILGWSYGGYAALQAGATDPALFRAIVAIAPITDLQQYKTDWRDYTRARNIAEFVGDGPHVAQGSPLRNVASIRAPVLLFHGDRDVNVQIIHSRLMHDALRDADKPSELHVFEGLEHDLADSAVRTRMLRRIGEFLGERLGQ